MATAVVAETISSAAWLRFYTITGVVRVGAWDCSINWDISGPGLILGSVENLFLISVGSLVGDDWDISGLLGDDSSVLGVVLSVVPGLCLISILGLRVRSCENFDLGSVPVLFLLSVHDFVVGLVRGEWNIVVLGLSVVSVDGSWLEGVSGVLIGSVLDLIGLGVPDLLFGSVLGLSLGELGGNWNLACSDLSLGLGLDAV